MNLFARLLTLSAFLLLPLTPLSAEEDTTAPAEKAASPFTDKEQEALGELIKEYIFANPEIVEQAMELAEEKRQREMLVSANKALKDNWDLIANDPMSYVAGNPDGDITVVEFFDYNCGWCKRATPVLMELLEEDKGIRMVLKEFPIRGKESDETARAAVAAVKQDGYFEAHQEAMLASGEMTLERFLDIAEKEGIDLEQLTKDLEDPKIEETIGTNLALAELLYISGTPSFVVGDIIVRGWPGKEGMEALIAQARAPKEASSEEKEETSDQPG